MEPLESGIHAYGINLGNVYTGGDGYWFKNGVSICIWPEDKTNYDQVCLYFVADEVKIPDLYVQCRILHVFFKYELVDQFVQQMKEGPFIDFDSRGFSLTCPYA